MTTDRIRVWDLPTRLFHWLLAASFAGAWLTADSERWINVHTTLGYAFAGLIAFRLVWGLVGPRYARFSSFVRGPGAVKRYLLSLLTLRPEHHVGHNPAGGAMVIALLLMLGVITGTGHLMTTDAFWGVKWVEELHELAANLTLGLIALHVLGVLVASFEHGENLVRAMITGRKRR